MAFSSRQLPIFHCPVSLAFFVLSNISVMQENMKVYGSYLVMFIQEVMILVMTFQD